MKLEKKLKKIISFLKSRYCCRHEFKDPFKILISCILSQRTREENTAEAYKKLFSFAQKPEEIVELPEEKLKEVIKPAGFYRKKAKLIKKICKKLLSKYGGEVPKSRSKLMKLPGIGLKSSAVVCCYGFDQPLIPVDVHVEVCSKRLGLVPSDASPKEVEERLEKLIKPNLRFVVNLGLVQFGREFCRTKNPKCDKCPLKGLCAYKDIKIF